MVGSSSEERSCGRGQIMKLKSGVALEIMSVYVGMHGSFSKRDLVCPATHPVARKHAQERRGLQDRRTPQAVIVSRRVGECRGSWRLMHCPLWSEVAGETSPIQ